MHTALNTKNLVSLSQLLQVSYLSLLLGLKIFVLSESPWSPKVSFKRQCSALALLGSSGQIQPPFPWFPCLHSLWHFINKYWESVRVQDSCPRYNDKEDNPTVTAQRKTKNWVDLSMTLAEKLSACTRDLWKRLLYILSWSRCSLCTVVYCRHIILWLQWTPCGWMWPHLSHILLKSWALYWKQ